MRWGVAAGERGLWGMEPRMSSPGEKREGGNAERQSNGTGNGQPAEDEVSGERRTRQKLGKKAGGMNGKHVSAFQHAGESDTSTFVVDTWKAQPSS